MLKSEHFAKLFIADTIHGLHARSWPSNFFVTILVDGAILISFHFLTNERNSKNRIYGYKPKCSVIICKSIYFVNRTIEIREIT